MRTHQELLAWQRAHAVVLGVFRYGRRHWEADRGAAIDQLRRAALSVQLNIAEAYASGYTLRSKNLLRVAYGSAVETTDVLELLVELDAAGAESLKGLIGISRETQALTLRMWKQAGPRRGTS